jgi:hypothetical protein
VTNPAGIAVLVAGLALLPACATQHPPAGTAVTTQGDEVSVELVFNSGLCGRAAREAALTRLDATTLADFVARLASHGVRFDAAALDPQRDAILLVEMGQKPTAGYGLRLSEMPARRVGTTLEIPFRWSEPAPGAITAQVVTSPCVLLRVDAGDARSVRIVDEQGQVLLEGSLD